MRRLHNNYISLNDELENFTVSWSNITGKPNTFAPSSHTHTLNSCTGGLTSRTLQWVIGSEDYVQLREADQTSTTKCLNLVFHDSSTNRNNYNVIMNDKGELQLATKNHNHDDRYYTSSEVLSQIKAYAFPIGEDSPVNLPSTDLNSCRVNIAVAFTEQYLSRYRNLPVNSVGIFISRVLGIYCCQEYITYDNSNNTICYKRFYNSEGWKAWSKL